MSREELKYHAKNHVPKIKHYYMKPRIELIKILTMKDLPESFIIEKKKIVDLRKEAIAKGYANIWKLKRAELVELLYPRPNQNNQNDDHTKKHDQPEKGEGK